MNLMDLFRKPSGKAIALRRIEESQRLYIEYMTLSEQHASLSAHNLNEANRAKNQIYWLKEFVNQCE